MQSYFTESSKRSRYFLVKNDCTCSLSSLTGVQSFFTPTPLLLFCLRRIRGLKIVTLNEEDRMLCVIYSEAFQRVESYKTRQIEPYILPQIFPKELPVYPISQPISDFLKLWLLRLGRKLPYTNQRKNEWPHALRLVSNYPIEGHQFRTKSMGYDLLVACNRLNFTTVIRSSMD